jgi:hypothetical protein
MPRCRGPGRGDLLGWENLGKIGENHRKNGEKWWFLWWENMGLMVHLDASGNLNGVEL